MIENLLTDTFGSSANYALLIGNNASMTNVLAAVNANTMPNGNVTSSLLGGQLQLDQVLHDRLYVPGTPTDPTANDLSI